MSFSLKRTEQCAKCPWKIGTDPHQIPNGYDPEKHRALKCTVSDGSLAEFMRGGLGRAMACHEEHSAHCLGWLMNQLGPGNNLGLRMAMLKCENLGDVVLHGKQHQRFEDTLPN